MSLKERINEDMKSAMRAHETVRLGAIRLLLAAIKQKEVDEHTSLDDTAIVRIVEKQIKQRKDAATQYAAGHRQDLVDKENFEAEVLKPYLPAGLSDQEIADAVSAAIAETGATGPADMGKVMGVLKPRLAGHADMATVSARVKLALSGR